MRGVKAKPLSFLIGIVLVGVSVFGFMVTSPDREDYLILHSLSMVGMVIGLVLLIYGLIPQLRIGQASEMESTVVAIAIGVLSPFRLLVGHPILTASVLGAGVLIVSYWQFQHESILTTPYTYSECVKREVPTPSPTTTPQNSRISRIQRGDGLVCTEYQSQTIDPDHTYHWSLAWGCVLIGSSLLVYAFVAGAASRRQT